ncbi:MAG: response regulator [Desulfuromusa sp.]|nr:response regulator [Desulfuromusa sp.]
MAKKKLGEILIENKLISAETLNQALHKQGIKHRPLGQILEEMDVILEEDIAQGLSTQFNIPYLKHFARYDVENDALETIDAGLALAKQIFPLKIDNKTLYLAMANPLDMALQSELVFRLGMRISTFVATPEEIKLAIKKHYKTLQNQQSSNVQSILHIDANNSVLSAVQRMLDQHGIRGCQAHDGTEGLRLAVELRPQLIVTDIALPKLDGKTLFHALQEQQETAHIPVIALSSNPSTKEECELLEMGFYDFMAKPLEKDRFLARVKRGLQHAYLVLPVFIHGLFSYAGAINSC